jgi:hypothetical protein
MLEIPIVTTLLIWCLSPYHITAGSGRIEQSIDCTLDVGILILAGGKEADLDQEPDGGLAHPGARAGALAALGLYLRLRHGPTT